MQRTFFPNHSYAMNDARRGSYNKVVNGIERTLATATMLVTALVLVAPLIVMAPPLPNTFFPFIVGKAIYTHTMIEIAVGMWVVLAIRRPEYRPPRSWLLPIFVVYVVLVLLSSLFGVSPQRSIWSTYERMQGFVDVAHWLAFVIVVSSVYRSWTEWRVLLNFNLCISVVMAILGLGQRYDIQVLGYLTSTDRVDITLGNPTYVGAYMLVNILIALGFLGYSLMKPTAVATQSMLKNRHRRKRSRRVHSGAEFPWMSSLRIFWVSAIVLDSIILYMSGTRGAVVGLAGGIVAFSIGYMIWGRDRRIKFVATFLLTSVMGLALLFVAVRENPFFDQISQSSVMLSRLSNIGPNDESVTGRVNSALIGLHGFVARPVLGWGPENFTVAYDRYVTREVASQEVISFDQAHNKLIEELTTKGVLGFLAYISVWMYLLWVLVRRVREQESQTQIFTMFAGAALVGYFFQNLFLFDTPGTVPQFYLLLSFVVYLDAIVVKRQGFADVPRTERHKNGFVSIGLLNRLQSGWATVLASVVVTVLLGMAIYHFNVRVYNGATIILQTIRPNISWFEMLDHFEGSIEAAPAMANYPRVVMLNRMTSNWDNLSQEQVEAALEIASREGVRGIEKEPEQWRLRLALASLYHRVSRSNPRYLPWPKEYYVSKSKDLAEEAERLAPERIEIHQLLVRQDIIEGNYDGARNRINRYLDGNSKAEQYFQAFKEEIDRAVNQ